MSFDPFSENMYVTSMLYVRYGRQNVICKSEDSLEFETTKEFLLKNISNGQRSQWFHLKLELRIRFHFYDRSGTMFGRAQQMNIVFDYRRNFHSHFSQLKSENKKKIFIQTKCEINPLSVYL